ncbi:MAG: cytochrome c3 family protein, partial [Deltaproteobacteria bacterium]
NDYASCLGCHNGMETKDELMRKNLRYAGEDLQICLSCHGGMDACHPILVPLLPGMKSGTDLGLSADGKIKCTTCHDPTPKGASGVALRGRVEGQPGNALCFRCHDKAELAGRNPHNTMTDRDTCKFCHDTMTDPGDEEAARVSFISNTRLICLRCHGQTGHPSGINHMVSPKSVLPEVFKLDGKGKITCTTCHNPHLEAGTRDGAKQHRFVVAGESMNLCAACHRR